MKPHPSILLESARSSYMRAIQTGDKRAMRLHSSRITRLFKLSNP